MKGGRIAILFVLLVVASITIWKLNLPPQSDKGEERLLFPQLTYDDLNKVDAIEVTQKNSSPINIYLADDGFWRVTEHYDYRASTVKIRQLLSNLKDAEKIEEKTSLAEYYGKLGVADPYAEEGGGKLMMLKSSDEIFSLIVGHKSKQISNGQYVRKHNEQISWLVNKRFELPGDTVKWLDQEMIHIEPDTVSTVNVTHSNDDESFTVIRNADGELTIENLGKDQEVFQKERLNSVIAVTDYLYFKDVVPQDEIELPEEHIRVNLKTKEGAIVDIKAYKIDNGRNYFIAATNSTPHSVYFSGWAFEVPDTVYNNVDQRLEEFLVDAESPEDVELEQNSETDSGIRNLE